MGFNEPEIINYINSKLAPLDSAPSDIRNRDTVDAYSTHALRILQVIALYNSNVKYRYNHGANFKTL